MNENVQLKIEMKNQIEAAKLTHNQLKEEHQRLIEQQKEQSNREYSQRAQDAKSNKYCTCCGNAKPLDIYARNVAGKFITRLCFVPIELKL